MPHRTQSSQQGLGSDEGPLVLFLSSLVCSPPVSWPIDLAKLWATWAGVADSVLRLFTAAPQVVGGTADERGS